MTAKNMTFTEDFWDNYGFGFVKKYEYTKVYRIVFVEGTANKANLLSND